MQEKQIYFPSLENVKAASKNLEGVAYKTPLNQNVTFSQLKGCIEYFVKKMFGPKKKMRFRPSFFPFTEPSAEVDMWDDEKNQWMEILGCGMVDPAVISNVGYDPEKWKGFAFGMGVERIAMLKHKINDIRLFYNGDVRFSEQFS